MAGKAELISGEPITLKPLGAVDAADAITVPGPAIEAVTLGRVDPNSRYQPDVDLTAFSGQDLGVSRRHAVLVMLHDTVRVIDLGSMNGTYLNGERLVPNNAYVLRQDDELGLANLTLQVSQ